MVMRPTVSHSPRREEHERRTQAFAAALDDVLGNLTDEHDVRMQSFTDYPIHSLHVRPDQGIELLQLHCLGPGKKT